jgi:hypothetical protein
VSLKNFKWCWKREKALCKKVVQKGACVDCGLGFFLHVVLDVFLIVCLVIFAVA